MPESKLIQIYKFDELDESAKERARDWYRQGAFDYEWYECTIDDAKQCAKILGIEISQIYFSGFSSQGDGACFVGSYSYAKGALAAIKSHAPSDTRLHRIASDLQEVQRRNFYRLSAHVKQRGHYSHEYCTEISVSNNSHEYGDVTEATEESIKEALRDFMRWTYRQLESEFDYLNSDESVDESIRANEYTFDSDGARSRY